MSYGQEIFRNKYRETMDSLNIIKDNYYDLDNQYQEEIKEKDEKIERLNNIIKKYEKMSFVHEIDLQNRINKAIEYIEHNRWCDITDFDDNYKEIVINADKVLKILKGEDNEI